MPAIARLVLILPVLAATVGKAQAPQASDDGTFRPTVLVRQGDAAGSGTVIASLPGETLILTAAHVVAEGDDAVIEVHRYNLGLENTRRPEGWPVRLPAKVVAADPAGDVAILRFVGKSAMPHVARLSPTGGIARGAAVTSVGIDGAEKLASWNARVVETTWFVMDPVDPDNPGRRLDVSGSPNRPHRRTVAPDPSGPSRPFLLTTRAPRQGRSGGGLFDGSGNLIGVCIGRVEDRSSPGLGVFATAETVRRLLRENDLEAVLARSDAKRLALESRPASAQSVVKSGQGHHNTSRESASTSESPRADRPQGGGSALRRP